MLIIFVITKPNTLSDIQVEDEIDTDFALTSLDASTEAEQTTTPEETTTSRYPSRSQEPPDRYM